VGPELITTKMRAKDYKITRLQDYLGSLMRWDGSLMKEIYNRIARMEQANKRLTREVFTIKYLPWNIRLSLFNSWCTIERAIWIERMEPYARGIPENRGETVPTTTKATGIQVGGQDIACTTHTDSG
jgi:hypothetical protein